MLQDDPLNVDQVTKKPSKQTLLGFRQLLGSLKSGFPLKRSCILVISIMPGLGESSPHAFDMTYLAPVDAELQEDQNGTLISLHVSKLLRALISSWSPVGDFPVGQWVTSGFLLDPCHKLFALPRYIPRVTLWRHSWCGCDPREKFWVEIRDKQNFIG